MTPPKPTIREKAREPKMTAKSDAHMYLGEWNAPSSPQTGEGECQACKLKPFGTIVVDDVHNPHCIQCGRKIVSYPPIAEEMEKDWKKTFFYKFRGLLRPNLKNGKKEIVNCYKEVEAYVDVILRKHLSMQREEFLKMIGEDEEQISGKSMDDFKYPTAKIRNQFRAELRSKLKIPSNT